MANVVRNRVFGIRIGDDLIYSTITSNPSKTIRSYKRLDRKDSANETFLSELEMRRKTVRIRKETYVGPMR